MGLRVVGFQPYGLLRQLPSLWELGHFKRGAGILHPQIHILRRQAQRFFIPRCSFVEMAGRGGSAGKSVQNLDQKGSELRGRVVFFSFIEESGRRTVMQERVAGLGSSFRISSWGILAAKIGKEYE